jgi:hypothetical protein
MTFSQKDLINYIKPRKNRILNANGDEYPVTCAGDVKISERLILKKYFVGAFYVYKTYFCWLNHQRSQLWHTHVS